MTEKELNVVKAIAKTDEDYCDGLGDPVWASWVDFPHNSLTSHYSRKTISGIISSLIKKEYIKTEDWDHGDTDSHNRDDDWTLAVTPLGKKILEKEEA